MTMNFVKFFIHVKSFKINSRFNNILHFFTVPTRKIEPKKLLNSSSSSLVEQVARCLTVVLLVFVFLLRLSVSSEHRMEYLRKVL